MHSGVCHIGISGYSLIYGVRKFSIPKGKPKIVDWSPDNLGILILIHSWLALA